MNDERKDIDEQDVELEVNTGEDVVSEDADAESVEGVEELAKAKITKMREELDNCRKEKQEYMDGWQRAKADYVNLIKRMESETDTAMVRGRVDAVETLLPAFDALERAKEYQDLPEGFAAIVKQIESAFSALGLEQLGRVGDAFNPSLHDALGQDIVAEENKDDIITSVLEKGWKVGTMIIRPAKVRVGHFINQS